MNTLNENLKRLIRQKVKVAEQIIRKNYLPSSEREDYINVFTQEIYKQIKQAGWKSPEEQAK